MKKQMILTGILAMALVVVNGQTTTAAKQDTLTIFRDKINQCDQQIVHLLGERMKAAKVIGEYKLAHKMEVLQSNRFNEVLQKAVNAGKEEGLSEQFIKAIYESIHRESIRQQEALKQ
jgi:chorismate mutase